MTMVARNQNLARRSRPPANRRSRVLVILGSLSLVMHLPSPSTASTNAVTIGALQVELSNARVIKCKRLERLEAAQGVDFDLCFSAKTSASIQLTLTAETEELLASVQLTTVALDDSQHRSSTTDSRPSGRTVFSKNLSIPRAPPGQRSSPDAPLVKASIDAFFRNRQATGHMRPGPYKTEVAVGHGASAQRLVLGIEVEALDGSSTTSQWPVAGGRGRILIPGCVTEQPDPVVELFLRDCEDPRFQVKAVAPKLQAGVTVANYVDNSLAAYRAIWVLESRTDSDTEPRHVKLELRQRFALEEAFLIKYFVDLSERVLVVTFYGPMDQKRQLRRRYRDLTDWLVLTRATDAQ